MGMAQIKISHAVEGSREKIAQGAHRLGLLLKFSLSLGSVLLSCGRLITPLS